MTVVSHVRELRKKHQVLSEAVEEAQKSLAMDDLQIATMKKQKLRINRVGSSNKPCWIVELKITL